MVRVSSKILNQLESTMWSVNDGLSGHHTVFDSLVFLGGNFPIFFVLAKCSNSNDLCS